MKKLNDEALLPEGVDLTEEEFFSAATLTELTNNRGEDGEDDE